MSLILNKYLIVSCLIISTSSSIFGQKHSFLGNSFILDLKSKDVVKLNFIEDSIIDFIDKGNYSEYYFEGSFGSIFDLQLTKSEAYSKRKIYLSTKKLDSYFFDINWQSTFRNFSVISFSRIYYDNQNKPLIKFPLSSYSKIFNNEKVNLIHNIIKQNISNKIDSNFIKVNKDEYKTHRRINLESYEIFPQTSLNIIEYIIKEYLLEGRILAYKNDSLIHELTKKELSYQYFTEEIKRQQYDNYSKPVYDDDGNPKMDISYGVCYFNSLTISEQIKFETISDTLSLTKYLNEYYAYQNKFSPLLTVNFNYKAIGIDYWFDMGYPIKTIWLKYDEVKEIMINEKINFELYEAIFTKNLFDIFKIDNFYWQESDYNKK